MIAPVGAARQGCERSTRAGNDPGKPKNHNSRFVPCIWICYRNFTALSVKKCGTAQELDFNG